MGAIRKIKYILSISLFIVFTSSILFGQNLNQSINKLSTYNTLKNQKSISLSTESDKIWLNLHNDQGAFSQILIGFLEGATNDIDRYYDGRRIFGSNPIAFYSICDSVKLAIQGREPRTNLVEEITLGIYNTVTEKITLQITIDELQGKLNDSNIEILLEDKLLNIEHDLKNTSYYFELSNEGTFDERFKIIIKESQVLNLDTFNLDDNLILIQNENQLNVKTKDNNIISSFTAFDLVGRTIIDIEPNNNEFNINTTNLKNGTILLINIRLINNQIISKKTILLK